MKIINLPFDGFTDKGISLYDLCYHGEAVAIFDKVIWQNNKAVVAYYYRGLSKYVLNQFEEAIADYDIVIHLYSEDEEVYVNRSLSRLALKQYKLAIYDCNQAIRINPHNSDAFKIRGTAKIKLGDAISGSEDLDKARQLRARWEVRVANLHLSCVII